MINTVWMKEISAAVVEPVGLKANWLPKYKPSICYCKEWV